MVTTGRSRLRPLARALVVVVLAGSTVALGGLRPSAPAGHGELRFDPGRFTTRIDNPFWPMAPGNHWVYREIDADGSRYRVEVTVTERTTTILGIQARVVRDCVFEHERPLEDAEEWYAQDAQGNLWLLGEVRHEYGGAEPSTDRSWRAGVAGAQPVLVLPDDPEPGTVYRQRDAAVQVLTAATTAKVPFGSFQRLLVTREWAPPASRPPEHPVEDEFYARGIGPVLAVTVSGGSGREELVGFDDARSAGTATG